MQKRYCHFPRFLKKFMLTWNSLLSYYLLADLESGSRRSKAEADTLARAATNLGDPMSLEGESHRAGEEATIRLASSSHS